MFRITNLAAYRSRRFLLALFLVALFLILAVFRGEIQESSYRLVSFQPAAVSESTGQWEPGGLNSTPKDPLEVQASGDVEDALESSLLASSPTMSPAPQVSSVEPPQLEPIINNFVSYPRLPPMKLEEFNAMREVHVRHIEALIKNPLEMFSQYNVRQLERLKAYWNEVRPKDGVFEQPKVVLSSYGYIPCAMTVCRTTGEVIWLESLMNIFWENNYFLLWDEYEHIGGAYKHYGDTITHVWLNDYHVVWCLNDTIHCTQSPDNPDGIPPWQMSVFTFWGNPPGYDVFKAPKDQPWTINPLGSEWNLVPYQMPENQFYLGYHYTGCEDLPYIPPAERKNQILILAKKSNYFHQDVFLHPSWWGYINNGTPGLDLVSVAQEEDEFPIPVEMVTLGPQERHAYDLMLGSSRALLGVGRPRISPSPFASLCRGVPVILPYKGRHCPAQPNSTEWCGFHDNIHQHGAAAQLGEPYVYTVDVQGPREDIVETIMRAVNTPIKPFIPSDMTIEAVTQRVKDYFAIDWKGFTAQRMKEKGWERVETQDYMYQWLEKNPVKEQEPV